MIKLKKFVGNTLVSCEPIVPTLFPDGTSQVWKIQGLSSDEPYGDNLIVYWKFESEAEVMHMCSLLELLRNQSEYPFKVVIPYLPYARQDKAVSNTTTFNLCVLERILSQFVSEVYVFDQHSISNRFFKQLSFINDFHLKAIMDCGEKQYNVVFPDEGAVKKYQEYIMPHFKKKRNQLTGEIEALEFSISEKRRREFDSTEVFFLIDDICDGGRTFIECAKVLKVEYPRAELRLIVSHGIFSKGYDELNQYFTKIYSTHSLKNDVSIFNIEARINKGDL